MSFLYVVSVPQRRSHCPSARAEGCPACVRGVCVFDGLPAWMGATFLGSCLPFWERSSRVHPTVLRVSSASLTFLQSPVVFEASGEGWPHYPFCAPAACERYSRVHPTVLRFSSASLTFLRPPVVFGASGEGGPPLSFLRASCALVAPWDALSFLPTVLPACCERQEKCCARPSCRAPRGAATLSCTWLALKDAARRSW
jgi:hypothetical protein